MRTASAQPRQRDRPPKRHRSWPRTCRRDVGRGSGRRRAICDSGAPLAAAKTVAADSEVDGQTESSIGGYTILEAASFDEAVGLVRGHPFLARGGALQVSEAMTLAG